MTKEDQKQKPDKQQEAPNRAKYTSLNRSKIKRPKRIRKSRSNEDGLDKKIVSIRRVARTYKGGKRLNLSVLLVVGDRKGKVGVGLAKGADVRLAQDKAYNIAKKNLIEVPLKGRTIPHEVVWKKKAAKIFMKPAAPGTGVIAGGALRAVLELAGVKDVLTKVIGSPNPISNVYAAIEALQNLIIKEKTKDVKQIKKSNN